MLEMKEIYNIYDSYIKFIKTPHNECYYEIQQFLNLCEGWFKRMTEF